MGAGGRRSTTARVGYATDGTPVDCVRFATLGLVEDFAPDLIVSGINHGSNLGDDITYSGTVAAAFEGARSSASRRSPSPSSRPTARWTSASGAASDFEAAAHFAARVVDELDDVPLPQGTLLNINVPGDHPVGVEVTRLGKRIYKRRAAARDRRGLAASGATGSTAPTRASTTSRAPTSRPSPTGRISVTPVHFDLTDVAGIDALVAHDLTRLLAPAARELG